VLQAVKRINTGLLLQQHWPAAACAAGHVLPCSALQASAGQHWRGP
jgi:hypothetical protein